MIDVGRELQAALPVVRDISPLAEHGQKIVYSAEHPTFGSVVIKLLKGTVADPRGQREIRVVSENDLPQVPKIHEAGTIRLAGDEYIYLIEQRIHGRSLREVLQDRGALPLAEALSILAQLLVIAQALDAVNLIHRDIKPENILLDEQGKVWLLDFGIVRALDYTVLTAESADRGPHTMGYAPPEVYRNEQDRVAAHSDLFSIGVVAYELISGAAPYGLPGADRSGHVVQEAIEAGNAAPLILAAEPSGKLAGFIGALISPHLSRRPPNAAVALAMLERVQPQEA